MAPEVLDARNIGEARDRFLKVLLFVGAEGMLETVNNGVLDHDGWNRRT
jgi:hypothetical protein